MTPKKRLFAGVYPCAMRKPQFIETRSIYRRRVRRIGLLWEWLLLRHGSAVMGGYAGTRAEAREKSKDTLTAINRRLSNWRPTS